MEEIINFFLPKTCVVCGVEGCNLCTRCKRDLGVGTQICPMCGEDSVMGWTHQNCKTKEGLDGLIYMYEYGDPLVRRVIDAIKYDFNKELVSELLRGVFFEFGEKFDYLVPIPLYFYRENWRGFNQAELIAKVMSLSSKIKVDILLERIKNTKQQALMKTKEDRENNIKNAFSIDKNSRSLDLSGKKVLLVDDVFTTGSNMKECCKVLKRVGVVSVWGFALGH